MIDIRHDLIEPLETKLNAALNAKTPQGAYVFPIQGVPRNTLYKFHIFTDTGEYSEAIKSGATVTKAFNAICRIRPISLEGATPEAYTASAGALIDFLIPLQGLKRSEKDSFISGVRRLFDSTLQNSSGENITDSDGSIYLVICRPSIMQTGARDIRDTVGDSLIITLSLEYSIIANGILADTTKVTIDGVQVLWSNLGVSRRFIMENGVPSTSLNGSAGNFANASIYTLTMSFPSRFGILYEKYIEATETGINEPMTVVVTDTIGSGKTVTHTHTMIFSELGKNGLTGASGSMTISLVEYLAP